MIPAALCGALMAGGLVLVWAGLHPQPEPLAAVLGRLGRPLPAPAPSTGERVSRLGERLERTDYGRRYIDRLAGDLRVVGRRPADELSALVIVAVTAAAAPAVFAILAAVLLGVLVPPVVVLVLTPALVVVVGLQRVANVRSEASDRREQFRASLAAFCDLCGMNLAAGRGVTQALETAANLGEGWAFSEMRAALVAARERSLPASEGLERLGVELDIDDLVEVAGSIRLAGTNGAAVRETLNHKARTMRDRLTSQAERRAAAVTERLGLPAAAVLMGLVAFYLYPVFATLLNP